MTMSVPLSTGGEALFDLPSNSSQAGSPASRSPGSDLASAWRTSGGGGRGCEMSSTLFDPDSSSSRTSPTYCGTLAHFTASSATFPTSGSMRSGRLYLRAPWVPHTHVSGCSYWPTARAGDGEQPVHLPALVPSGCAGPGAEGGDARTDRWLPEPDVRRVADGVPKRLVAPHLHALGNAVVPPVSELVGRLVMSGAVHVQ